MSANKNPTDFSRGSVKENNWSIKDKDIEEYKELFWAIGKL